MPARFVAISMSGLFSVLSTRSNWLMLRPEMMDDLVVKAREERARISERRNDPQGTTARLLIHRASLPGIAVTVSLL